MTLHAPPLRRDPTAVSTLAVAFCCGLALVGPVPIASGQGIDRRPPSTVYPETDGSTEALIRTATAHVRQGQWEAAIELYQRALQRSPEALTALRDAEDGGDREGFGLYVNVSEYAQRELAQLPPEALKTYRARVDGEARHYFEEGRDRLDEDALRRVVDTFFCSSSGDDATELLADLAFQDGRFEEARALYGRLVAIGDDAAGALVYPDPDVDVARVAAKALLTRAALDEPPSDALIAEFAQRYPDADGALAGREGRYREIVAEALREDGLEPPPILDNRWPTFAGAADRSKVVAEPVDPGQLVWSIPLRTPLDPASNVNATPPRFGLGSELPADDTPPFFPILKGDEVLLTDGRQVVAYPLAGLDEGRPVAVRPSWVGGEASATPAPAARTVGLDRHTLTVHGDRIYARVGSYGIEYQGRNNGAAPQTAIIALDRQGRGEPLWKASPSTVLGDLAGPNVAFMAAEQVGFGGSPVADDEGVYVTLLKPGTQALTWVACLDPQDGRPRWVRYICSATSPAFERGDGGFRNQGVLYNPDLGHRLLTLRGSTLYYQTDLGALASLDARTGRLNWLATYPRTLAAPTDPLEQVNHNPAVVAGGLVLVAPQDAERVFAFDAETGRLAWQADPGGRIAYLLGAAEGRVVATGNHVWTIDAADGAILSRWPEARVLEEGHGRGLIADGQIYWPTRDRIYVLDLVSGLPTARPPIPLREAYGCGGGNLVADDGYLLIAENDRLLVFCKHSRMLRRIQERIAGDPDEPTHYYQLARTAEALGDDDLALASLAEVLDRAGPSDRVDGRRLVEAAADDRFKLLMRHARRAAADGEPAVAANHYAEAAAAAPGDHRRFEALLARSEALDASGDPAGAVGVLQGLLADAAVVGLLVPADEHRSVRADRLVVARLRRLIADGGRGLYAEAEAEADRLLERGRAEGDGRTLREVVRRFPVSEAAVEAFLALGESAEGREDWTAAVRTYQELIGQAEPGPSRAAGLLGLARSYEALGLRAEAREAYGLASALYGELSIEPDAGRWVQVRDYVSDRLALLAPGVPDEARGGPVPDPPLLQGEGRSWPDGYRPIRPVGTRSAAGGPTRRSPWLLLGDGSLMAFDADAEESLWTLPLDGSPTWFGWAGGLLVVAGDDRLTGVDPDGGRVAWTYRPDEAAPLLGQQFGDGGSADGPRFHEFLIEADRVFFLDGGRKLVRFDPVAGRPEWSYRTASEAIDPRFGVGLHRIVALLHGPDAIAVLDAPSGETLAFYPAGDLGGVWRRRPFPVTLDRVALVPGPDRVVLFDLEAGAVLWESIDASPLPTAPQPSPGDPHVFGDAERLLVLSGDRLQRLDPADGGVLWEADLGRLAAGGPVEPYALGLDAFYFIGRRETGLRLGAIDLGSGRPSWTAQVSADVNERWGLELSRQCVVAYRVDDGAAGTGGPVVLTLLRRDTGRRVQRSVVAGSGPARQVCVADGGLLVVGDEGVRWLVAEGAGPVEVEGLGR